MTDIRFGEFYEKLARVFHEAFVRVHGGASWDACAEVHRRAVMAGIMAVIAKQEPCDRADLIMRRSLNCGWITVLDEKQFLSNLRLALDTEVEAGGPYLNNGWNNPSKQIRSK